MGSAENVGNDQPMSAYTVKSLRALDGRFNADVAGPFQFPRQIL